MVCTIFLASLMPEQSWGCPFKKSIEQGSELETARQYITQGLFQCTWNGTLITA